MFIYRVIQKCGHKLKTYRVIQKGGQKLKTYRIIKKRDLKHFVLWMIPKWSVDDFRMVPGIILIWVYYYITGVMLWLHSLNRTSSLNIFSKPESLISLLFSSRDQALCPSLCSRTCIHKTSQHFHWVNKIGLVRINVS